MEKVEEGGGGGSAARKAGEEERRGVPTKSDRVARRDHLYKAAQRGLIIVLTWILSNGGNC